VIEKGRIDVLINGITKKSMLPGSGFGELALLYDAPR
jgi:cGMP-dependent protein kinase